MVAANIVLHDNKGVREASRLYNVPFKTLRRHINGSVKTRCKPGPGKILTEEEEDRLASANIRNRVWFESRYGCAPGLQNH